MTDPILIVLQESSLFTNRWDAVRYEVTDSRRSRLHELWRYRRAYRGYGYHILDRYIYPESTQREYEEIHKYSPLTFTHHDMPPIIRRLTCSMGNSTEGNIPSSIAYHAYSNSDHQGRLLSTSLSINLVVVANWASPTVR